ncbi:glycoside hydrolase family 113 [Actinoplanes siamensis]|uniref:Uncharacterized protein n=1 Tax=Actinoplanes siamensis TaxID=1223317 RepID=A0A919NDR1_9ACTN|nr:hypothetical protein [Actinoplanes siamensis]GIF08849.1 hypothetical protein Asi03nite_63870 [Actinoplanes siamensis]
MNRSRAAVALLLIATQLAACTRLAPSAPRRPQPAESLPEPSRSAQSAGPAVRTVSAAARATTAQLGVQIFWHGVNDPDALRANATRLLDYVVGLGANSVGITFPISVDGARPTRVYATPGVTPTPSDLRELVALARERGLRVQLRPLIDEANLKAAVAWRGSIEPRSVSGWFTSYTNLLVPFLEAAQESGADVFVIGSELDSLVRYESQWRAVVVRARTLFRGRLAYADNWGSWATGRPTVPGVEPGVDAYPKLGVDDSSSTAKITRAWTAWFGNRPADLTRTVVQEIGIAATSGAYHGPAAWPRGHETLRPDIQIRWFAGACAAARSLHLAGIYFWTLDAWADPANAAGYDVGSFIGRGDQAIKECFANGWPSR